ncbi:MAG: formylmethanofuran dehydrogenase subunit, partial [Thermoproteota archaeon]|nr:formylmethanofuran dehydrogenase subunit [Thermoproteota archaeon]
GELFKIDGEIMTKKEDLIIQLLGDLRKVRRIGFKMSTGKIVVEGDVENHLGEEMSGGVIIVNGSAGSWTGSMMYDGIIEVRGNAGDYVGSAYRGSLEGMKGGIIVIDGNVGNELGCFMRGGIIKVNRSVGQFAGMHMRQGTIFIRGDSEGRLGAEMIKGKIVVSGSVPSILPTFSVDNISKRTRVGAEEVIGPFYTFVGDLAENGEGRLFISQASNPYLKTYDKFIG